MSDRGVLMTDNFLKGNFCECDFEGLATTLLSGSCFSDEPVAYPLSSTSMGVLSWSPIRRLFDDGEVGVRVSLDVGLGRALTSCCRSLGFSDAFSSRRMSGGRNGFIGMSRISSPSLIPNKLESKSLAFEALMKINRWQMPRWTRYTTQTRWLISVYTVPAYDPYGYTRTCAPGYQILHTIEWYLSLALLWWRKNHYLLIWTFSSFVYEAILDNAVVIKVVMQQKKMLRKEWSLEAGKQQQKAMNVNSTGSEEQIKSYKSISSHQTQLQP